LSAFVLVIDHLFQLEFSDASNEITIIPCLSNRTFFTADVTDTIPDAGTPNAVDAILVAAFSARNGCLFECSDQMFVVHGFERFQGGNWWSVAGRSPIIGVPYQHLR
jgi:hypothetical protein